MPIATAFAENFATRGEIGASLSIWKNGQEIVSLHHGQMAKDGAPWTADTLVPIWSATKGLAAACCLRALHAEGYTLDSPVADIWPGFAQAGKANITIGQTLSHQAGLSGLEKQVPITDYPAVVAALEKQTPAWTPGTAHGYHPRTWGFLADEMLRRITGARSLAHYFHHEIAAPLKLDLWIGLPQSEFPRVATLYPARLRPDAKPHPFLKAFHDPSSETRRAFASPTGLNAIADMNSPAGWTCGLPSMGGVGTARSLAKFYSTLATGGGGLFAPQTLAAMNKVLASGQDRTLLAPTAFSAGFMVDVDKTTHPLLGPSPTAFGHPGAGGSHAFADPENRIAFAYTMNQMEPSPLPNQKSLSLIQALYEHKTLDPIS